MYDFVYVDTKTMLEDDYFLATTIFVQDYKNRSTPGPVSKYWIEFSYIHSQDYELDLKFDEKRKKGEQKTQQTKNNEFFYKKILIIE